MNPPDALFDTVTICAFEPAFADQLRSVGYGACRADQEDRLRVRGLDLGDDVGEHRLRAVERGDEDRLLLRLVEAFASAYRAIGAERVVHVHEGDAREADAGEVVHRLLGLSLVGGAHIEDPWVDRPVQHHRPGRRGHQRNLVFVQQGHDRLRVRGAAIEKQRDDVLFGDQDLGVLGRLLSAELVVHRDQLDLLSVNPARLIDVIDVKPGTHRVFLHPRRDRPCEARGLSDQNLRPQGRCGRKGGQAERQRAPDLG